MQVSRFVLTGVLLGCRQTCCCPGSEAASHRTDVFVARFLQRLGGKRGSPAAATMTNDRGVLIRHFFFDVELDRAATHVSRAGNVSFIPFFFISDIDDDPFAPLYFSTSIVL